MNRKNGGLAGTPFSFCNVLRPFAKGCEGNIVELTVLLACKAAGSPGSNMLLYMNTSRLQGFHCSDVDG
ncbi:hypothetical protein HX362_004632 [Salmonella enterica]|nr:hypothetical protein [Salmonella enterica]